jgi:hypothetical protein
MTLSMLPPITFDDDEKDDPDSDSGDKSTCLVDFDQLPENIEEEEFD